MEYKATIRFSSEAWKTIEYFTKNLTTEIGAVGTTKVITNEEGDKIFYIKKLFFPKQEVTTATVNIKPEMWSDLIKEATKKELGQIGFYWHRHPSGNPHHSGTDEDDTYEMFMGKDIKPQRKHFIFIQTAYKTAEKQLVWEARIDITSPIRTTILNDDIVIEVEESPLERKYREMLEAENERIKEQCEKIKAEKVMTETFTFNSSWNTNFYPIKQNNTITTTVEHPIILNKEYDNVDAVLKELGNITKFFWTPIGNKSKAVFYDKSTSEYLGYVFKNLDETNFEFYGETLKDLVWNILVTDENYYTQKFLDEQNATEEEQ